MSKFSTREQVNAINALVEYGERVHYPAVVHDNNGDRIIEWEE